MDEDKSFAVAIKTSLWTIAAVTSNNQEAAKHCLRPHVVRSSLHPVMQKSRGSRQTFLNLEAETSQLLSQRERMKQLSKSLGDLPNFKKEIDEKLKGKLPKPSPRLQETRRLGETGISLEIDDAETSLVTRDCICVLQPNIKQDSSNLKNGESFTPPSSKDYQRLREIVKENNNFVDFDLMRQKTLKVDDIVHTASKLEAEYLKRAKSPVYLRNCTCLYGNNSVCEGSYNSENPQPSSKAKKRTLIVKIPRMSDNLNDYNCGREGNSNFSYRHKK